MPVASVNSEPDKMEPSFDHLEDNYQFHFVKKLDEDIKLEPDASPKKEIKKEPIELFETEETHVNKQLKLNDGKVKKIRRLEPEMLTGKRRNAPPILAKGFPMFRTFFLLTTLSAIAVFFFVPEIVDELMQHARKEYNVMQQGKSYCTNSLDPSKMIQALRDNVVGQNAAIDSIESALRSDEPFKSLIFAGPTGTGKTMSSQLLSHNFPWQENTQILIHNPDSKFDLTSITRKMSTCGFNLLIIDDLTPLNADMLNVKKALQDVANEKGFKLVLIFIFNVSKEADGLANQNGHHSIEFRRLTDLDLDQCMQRIEQELAVTMSTQQRDSVKASVDINKNGCKNVRSKVSLYA